MTGPLNGVLLVRFAHAYGRHGGVNHHLQAVERVLSARNALQLVTLHPDSQCQPDRVRTPLRRVRDALLRRLHPPRLAHRTAYRIPVPASAAADLRFLTAFASELRALRRLAPDRPAVFVDHGPSRPYAEARLRLAREAGYATAIMHHGGFLPPAVQQLRRASPLAGAAGGVTLRGHDGCLGHAPMALGNGVDLEVFTPRDVPPGAFRMRWGIPWDRIIILVVGRIVSGKGPQDIPAALRQCHMQHGLRGATLVFAGTVVDRACAEEVQSQLEAIPFAADISCFFVGELPACDLREAYLDASLLLHPSRDEGVPRVVLEAQAMGCPVVATRVGGTEDAMLPGVTGLLVPPGDPEALSDGLASALRRVRAGTFDARAARDHVRRHFSVDALAERYEALCLRALGLPDAR